MALKDSVRLPQFMGSDWEMENPCGICGGAVFIAWRNSDSVWAVHYCEDCGDTVTTRRLARSDWRGVKMRDAVRAIKAMTGVDVSELVLKRRR